MSKEKHRFYAPPEDFSGESVCLSEEESRHARKVLRVQEGDLITVVDGMGATCLVEVTMLSPVVAGNVRERKEDVGESAYSLHIALGILHQPGRWETFLEKAVELGCTRITPLTSERTQSSRLKMRRLHHILVSALKQSGRSRLPRLDEPTSFEDILRQGEATRIICHEASPDARPLRDVLGKEKGLSVLIGPEGGFSDGEVAMAGQHGWETVWLGPRRLRAETAAMAVAAATSLHRPH